MNRKQGAAQTRECARYWYGEAKRKFQRCAARPTNVQQKTISARMEQFNEGHDPEPDASRWRPMKNPAAEKTTQNTIPHGEPVMKEIVWADVLRQLKRTIESDVIWTKSLKALTQSGCDENLILRKLYMYCGGGSKNVEAAKNDFRHRLRFVQKLARDLKQDVPARIEEAHSYLADAGVAIENSPVDVIQEYGEVLEKWARVLLKDLASKRVSGRDHHLVFLATYLQMFKVRDRYRRMAHLVEAVGGPAKTPDALRKLVNRSTLDLDSLAELQRLAKNDRQRRKLVRDFQRRLRRNSQKPRRHR